VLLSVAPSHNHCTALRAIADTSRSADRSPTARTRQSASRARCRRSACARMMRRGRFCRLKFRYSPEQAWRRHSASLPLACARTGRPHGAAPTRGVGAAATAGDGSRVASARRLPWL